MGKIVVHSSCVLGLESYKAFVCGGSEGFAQAKKHFKDQVSIEITEFQV